MVKATGQIWHNGRLIAWDDAKIHVLSHVTSYGSSVFEGIRCYATAAGPAVFRAREHMRRLHDSAKIYRIEIPFSIDQLCSAALEVIRVNKLESCYVRPLVIRGYGNVGVLPGKDTPVNAPRAMRKRYGGDQLVPHATTCSPKRWVSDARTLRL